MADFDQNRGDETPERAEPIVRDRRRVDPVTGRIRTPEPAPATAGETVPEVAPEGYEGPDVETKQTEAPADAETGSGADGAVEAAEKLAAERLEDLQRVNAEYANYRKRTEANREVDRERALAETLAALLPVLDDLDLAQQHGDLDDDGAFATIAAKLRGVVEKLGAVRFGEIGDAFDHNVHEALFQQPSAEVEQPTVTEVVQAGYHVGETLLRAAKVVVAAPEG